MQQKVTFADVVRTILRDHPEGMTPQEIRDVVKIHFPEFFETESNLRNVQNGNYNSVDNAVLARIYVTCRNARDIFADNTVSPHRMTIEGNTPRAEVETDTLIEDENLEKLAADIGTLYVLGTHLFTAEGREIIKIGITTGSVEKRIAQLYTTGVPYRFRVISQFDTNNYSKLEQALHCLFDKYRINRAREFFTDHCLSHIEDLISIHNRIESN